MSKVIKALLVDDEPYSIDELKHLLSFYPNIQIVGEAGSGETAVMRTIELQPDVVFLDIEMPKTSGMAAAKAMMELKKAPLIVFTTAYPQFAAEAFRLDVVDYLLKPYDEEQLHDTVQRLEKHFNRRKEPELDTFTSKLAIECDGEIIYIEPKDVLYIIKEEKLTKLITNTNEYETKSSLKDLESKLLNYGFFRVHKSFLVNLEYVTRLSPWFNGAYQLQIAGRKEMISVSRNYVKALRTRLEIK